MRFKQIPNLKPLAKGILSFAVPKLGTVHGYDNPLGTLAADSCYSIFLRHVCLLRGAGVVDMPMTVAELGPGSSHGVGFAALIAGAERYYALDLIDFSNTAQNLVVFDQIATMFRERRPIPSSGLHSLRFPDLDDYSFPDFLAISTADRFENRIAAIRQDIASGSGRFVRIAAPWMENAVIETNSIEWVFSQSVLEHIDDLEGAYATLTQMAETGRLYVAPDRLLQPWSHPGMERPLGAERFDVACAEGAASLSDQPTAASGTHAVVARE